MDVLLDNLDLFGPFFLTTIELFLIAGACSLVLGTILAMLRVSPVPLLRAIGTTYVTLLRNTPLTLVFAFLVFAYPLLDIVKIDYFPTAAVALTIYTSAFICEVVRSGINTVPIGQAEAGRALGLSSGQILGGIVLPQALRSVVPPLVSMLIALLKNTTIASGFSVAEAGAIRQYVSERGDDQMVALLWVALGFIILVSVLSLVQRSLEKRWSVAR
ncbi:amino acid ABC transporter permease [Amycolatopsis silviterrae]|uniref:Amino acid ABC transporter permease n=1 Tax=Amycolatopsis silviterrae TaxID=1656914 RepID=A0ABW5HL30_9PSEU